MPRKKTSKPKTEVKADKRYLSASDGLQEWRLQRKLQDMLQRRYRRLLASEIKATVMASMSNYRITGSLPKGDDSHVQAITDIYMRMGKDAANIFGQRVMDQGKSLGYELETKSFGEFFARLALEWIAQEAIRLRITSVAETTRQWIIDRIARGQEEGLSVDEIATGIEKDITGISRYRGALIARTETHGAANYAANEAAKATGLKLRKEWVSVEDARTRDFGEGDGEPDEYNHRSMDGQTVDMDQPFKMPHKSGEEIDIMYPGEAGKPAAAVINCRCAVAHVVED